MKYQPTPELKHLLEWIRNIDKADPIMCDQKARIMRDRLLSLECAVYGVGSAGREGLNALVANRPVGDSKEHAATVYRSLAETCFNNAVDLVKTAALFKPYEVTERPYPFSPERQVRKYEYAPEGNGLKVSIQFLDGITIDGTTQHSRAPNPVDRMRPRSEREKEFDFTPRPGTIGLPVPKKGAWADA